MNHTTRRARRAAFTGISLFALAITSPALAQDAESNLQPPIQDAPEDAGIADIVVTAQRRAENVQDVPIAISAVTAEALASRNVSKTAEITNFVPNVQLDASAPIFRRLAY